MLLKNKKIVVTGGARGLGRAFAEAAIAAGAHVAIADILEERGRETAKETGAHFAHVDLGAPESIAACLSACAAALGGLVNVTILVDGGLIEVFLNGLVTITALVDPSNVTHAADRISTAASSADSVDCSATTSWQMASVPPPRPPVP